MTMGGPKKCQPPPAAVAAAPGTGHPPEAPPVAHPQQPTDQVHPAAAEVKAEAAGSMTSLSAAEAADERPSAAKYPRIVESSIASAGPKIVDSIAPQPQATPPAPSLGADRRRSSADSQRDDSAGDSDAEVVILTPLVTSSSAPLTSSMLHAHQPIGKAPEVEMLAQLKAESDGLQSNLTLQELMLGESMGSLADSKHSALSDLARIATKHKGSLKDVKLHPQSADSVQITVVSKGDQANSRPSVIQKSATATSTSSSGGKSRSDPQPAHNQKPITPLNPPAELCQYYAQLLAESNKTGTSLLNDPVGLSLTLGMNLRPPTPAAATPSIFVPTHRIFTDPNLDIKKNRSASANPATPGASANSAPPAGGSIPPAHSKTAPVQGKPPTGPQMHQQAAPPAAPPQSTPPAGPAPPTPSVALTPSAPSAVRSSAPQPHHPAHHPAHHHSSPAPSLSTAASIRSAPTPPPLVSAPPPLQPLSTTSHRPPATHHPIKVESSIPLVDLTSRHSSVPASQSASAHRNADVPIKTEVNGKCLLDLSNKQLQQQLIKSPPSLKHSPWSSSPKASGDVSISVNVKVEGQESKRSSEPSAAAQAAGRHSVTVMPVIKDERHRTSKTSDKDRVSVTPMHHASSAYPRMVESLVGHSPGGSGAAHNSAKTSNSYYGSGSGSSKAAPPSGSSTSSAPAKSSPAAAEPAMMYPHMLDPTLASYYSSLYSQHNLYNSLQAAAAAAAANPFLTQAPPGFPPHLSSASASAAAAEVTAQVYKDLVQRGYPPALAPGLPPHLGALAANIPGLGSLAPYTSMYTSLGGKDGTGNGERSIPKS